jgi:hypothetical protein
MQFNRIEPGDLINIELTPGGRISFLNECVVDHQPVSGEDSWVVIAKDGSVFYFQKYQLLQLLKKAQPKMGIISSEMQ